MGVSRYSTELTIKIASKSKMVFLFVFRFSGRVCVLHRIVLSRELRDLRVPPVGRDHGFADLLLFHDLGAGLRDLLPLESAGDI